MLTIVLASAMCRRSPICCCSPNQTRSARKETPKYYESCFSSAGICKNPDDYRNNIVAITMSTKGMGKENTRVHNELQEFNGEEGVCSVADNPIQGSSFDTSNCHSLLLEPVGQDQNILGAAPPEMEAPALSFVGDRNGSCVASTAALAYDFSTHLPFVSGSEPSTSLPELAIQHGQSWLIFKLGTR
jgi:hypothetical protein